MKFWLTLIIGTIGISASLTWLVMHQGAQSRADLKPAAPVAPPQMDLEGVTMTADVIEFKPGREFFLADLFWLPPDGDPVGPMALEATCTQHGNSTTLHVRQSGWEDGPRWSRYYDLIATGFTVALEDMKSHLEGKWKD